MSRSGRRPPESSRFRPTAPASRIAITVAGASAGAGPWPTSTSARSPAEGATALLTTRYLEEADVLANHVDVIADGRAIVVRPVDPQQANESRRWLVRAA
jgi:hypothetical protein